MAHVSAPNQTDEIAQLCGSSSEDGPGRTAQKVAAFRPLNFFVNSVKDQSIKRSIEASRKIQERSRALVRESAMLIATAISLTDDLRLASARRKERRASAGWRVFPRGGHDLGSGK